MAWYAVVRRSNGAAVSFATSLPAALPADLEAITIARQPTVDEEWDANTRQMRPRTRAADPLAQEYAAALTDIQKLDVIAKRLNLR